MDEQEAKTKWCPWVRALPLAVHQSYAGETTREWKDGANCIAPDCAMWVWNSWKPKSLNTYEIEINKEAGGYCGLIK